VELTYLKTLVEVVRTGSLSKAADQLFVTQPAISRRIKFLEEQYGYPLLDRSGPRLRPTEAGRLVYEKAETLLAIEAELISGLEGLRGQVRISFSGTPSFGIAHLPGVLRDFLFRCGEQADLEFASNAPEQILRGLGDGRFEAAVMEVCDCFDLAGFPTYPLPGDEMAFFSAPRLALPSPEAPIDSLVPHPLFTRREGCCSRFMLDRNLQRIGRSLQDFRKTIIVDDLSVVVKAVLDGEGTAYLSRDIAGEHLDAGRLRLHRVEGFQRDRERALVLTRPGPLQGPMAMFVEALFGHFGVSVPEPLQAAAGSRGTQ
jgi:DNA-binding transcriptional LysR family regulator